jgi:hypothetical protein
LGAAYRSCRQNNITLWTRILWLGKVRFISLIYAAVAVNEPDTTNYALFSFICAIEIEQIGIKRLIIHATLIGTQ